MTDAEPALPAAVLRFEHDSESVEQLYQRLERLERKHDDLVRYVSKLWQWRREFRDSGADPTAPKLEPKEDT